MHSTSNLEDGYIGSGQRLWKSIKKHGKENHVKEILEYLPDRSSLKIRERELVNEDLLEDSLCMNLVRGGEGGIFNDEHHLKMRNGLTNWLLSKWKDPDYLEKHKVKFSLRFKQLHAAKKIKYDTFTGKSHSEASKKKIGIANALSQKGSTNSQYGTCWITNGNESKKISKYLPIPEGWSSGRKIKTKKSETLHQFGV
jgi:hypothetical protein